MKSPLIKRPDLQSPQQRTLYGALTLAFWVFWFYLWLPLLALLAWTLGVQQAYKYMVVLAGYEEILQIVGLYSLVILLLGGTLVLWAVYNIMRFSGVDKRTTALPVTPAQTGRYFGQDPEAVVRWHSEQRLYVTHDDAGHIANVEILVDRAAVPI